MPYLLVVDDDPTIRELLAEIATEEGYDVQEAASVKQARILIERREPDVVFLDMVLPDGDGMTLWNDLALPSCRVVFITGHSTVDGAIEALRCRALDYIEKPLSLQRLRTLLSDFKTQFYAGHGRGIDYACAKILGKSTAVQTVCAQIEKVAPTRATVLLIGESGTGKELAAEAIHLASPRHAKTFIPVNCGAISPNLIESELFGHEKGSFTGADRQHKGYFERACGGTLFLDEITEMSMELQVRLLRVLESGKFMRVGTHEEIEADVRIVAATNRNPEAAVVDGSLREDLYHRLSVFPIRIPPLRERGDDVVQLAHHFLDSLNKEHKTQKRFDTDVFEAIQHYPWPGNIRELRNFVYRNFILADQVIKSDFGAFGLDGSGQGMGSEILLPVGIPLADANRQLILATLKHCGGVKKLAAEALGISVKTLYNRLEEYGLEHEEDASRMVM